jgi:hypothetical protein
MQTLTGFATQVISHPGISHPGLLRIFASLDSKEESGRPHLTVVDFVAVKAQAIHKDQ